MSLIEKAQAAIDEKEALELGNRMMNQEFNYEDFKDAMAQMKKLGPLGKVLEMMPGVNSKELKGLDLSQSEKEMKKTEAIINSMTIKERKNPNIISSSASRRKRVAQGSGTSIQDVNKLIKSFEQMKKMMKQMNGMQKKAKKGFMGKLPFM